MRTYQIILILAMLIFLAACGIPEGRHAPTIPITATSTQIPTIVPLLPTVTAMATPPLVAEVPSTAQLATPTLPLQAWQSMPIIPVVSARMVDVYRAGLAAGRDPTHFSKIGDCQNITTYFLADFDNPKLYRLGTQYVALQPTINHFAGSWSRESIAVHGGMNVAAVQNPFWTLTPKPVECNSGETPLACEIRIFNPSFVIISMEESWPGVITKYDSYMRKIVEYVLSQNVVPILVTRAELPGSNQDVNDTVARIAYDYQVPLWNFWAATNPLPSHGLTVDGFHLTQAQDFFDDPASMQAGWPWRNLTALESIDAVYHALTAQP
jgi:hypothetical protein